MSELSEIQISVAKLQEKVEEGFKSTHRRLDVANHRTSKLEAKVEDASQEREALKRHDLNHDNNLIMIQKSLDDIKEDKKVWGGRMWQLILPVLTSLITAIVMAGIWFMTKNNIGF